MPKPPLFHPEEAGPCDPRLPQRALEVRLKHPKPLTTNRFLNGFNVTVWLYQDKLGNLGLHHELNTTIEELQRKFGPAQTPDAEVGFHSEMKAAQWFRQNSGLQVLQVFSERIPCPKMCGPMLRTYFSGVPWYYYYNKNSWRDSKRGRPIKDAAEVLRTVYGL